jgi:zona occludens toxin
MIYLYSGIPGAGKTLNAIKFICEDSVLKGRPVHYYGLSGCTLDNWNPLTDDQVRQWYNVESGSVIFIDECQKLWRPRMQGAPVPMDVQRLEDHRHQGRQDTRYEIKNCIKHSFTPPISHGTELQNRAQ